MSDIETFDFPPMDKYLMPHTPEISSQIFWLLPLFWLTVGLSASVRSCLSCFPGGVWVVVVLVSLIWFRLTRWFAQGGRFDETGMDLKGKTIIVTGANAGIGKNAAGRLAKQGARVIIGCRDPKRGQDALNEIKRVSGSQEVELMQLDLSSMASVSQFAKTFLNKYDRLDILMNNAGIMATPYGQTTEGHESQFGTNHLGHFLLTILLLPTLIKSKGRVVNVTSIGHWFAQRGVNDAEIALMNNKATYTPWRSYGLSKLGNILLAKELHNRFYSLGLVATAVHPGGIKTDLGKHMSVGQQISIAVTSPLFLKTISAGADSQMKCALDPTIVPGEYYQDCRVFQSSVHARNLRMGQWLWDYSMKAVANFVDAATIKQIQQLQATAAAVPFSTESKKSQ